LFLISFVGAGIAVVFSVRLFFFAQLFFLLVKYCVITKTNTPAAKKVAFISPKIFALLFFCLSGLQGRGVVNDFIGEERLSNTF
jgi:hypothetical protein